MGAKSVTYQAPVTKSEYLRAMAIVKAYKKQKGRVTILDFIEENPQLSVRARHVLVHASVSHFNFMDELTEENFLTIRNAGKRSQAEIFEVLKTKRES
jgi:DNA-directed RNA polymerase alpha subunit